MMRLATEISAALSRVSVFIDNPIVSPADVSLPTPISRAADMPYVIENETPENFLAARKSLEASLGLDPHSAEAWSQLA
jgi:hypothetical protein